MNASVIRTEKITRTYSMGDSIITALRDADLTVHAGEFIALMGASGSGKSTLLNVIGLLDRATSGEYWLEGNLSLLCAAMNWQTCAAGASDLSFRTSISCRDYLPGKMLPCRLPIARTSLGMQDQLTRAREALSRVNLDHRVDHQAHGIIRR